MGNFIVDHRRALSSPLFLAHRPVADQILAQHVLKLLRVAPVLRISVLQPKNTRRDVRRNVLNVLGVHGFLSVCWHEDFCCFVVITVGTGIERTRDAVSIPRCFEKRVLPPGVPADHPRGVGLICCICSKQRVQRQPSQDLAARLRAPNRAKPRRRGDRPTLHHRHAA
jgi:hypothetical protein